MLTITISKITKWGQQGNIAKLVEALRCENDEIRKAAALTLGKIGDKSTIEFIRKALMNEQNTFVKQDFNSSILMLNSKTYLTDSIELKEEINGISIRPLELKLDFKIGS